MISLLWGCSGHPSAAVRLAGHVDYTTTHAHMLLRVGFDESATEEDDADRLLLKRVAQLDAADADLPAKLARFESAEPAGGDFDAARRDVLRSLDAISANYAAVARTLRPRPMHDALREAIATLPPALERIRSHVTIPTG